MQFFNKTNVPDIAVTFTYEGKEYKGELSKLAGAGAQVWHLIVDKGYWGQLHFTERGWVFHPGPKFDSMKDRGPEFGTVVEPWYE